MAYTLSPKPAPMEYINWDLAPASLSGCNPLIQGEDPITTLEYVTRQTGAADTFVPNAFGATTWQSYGVNMNGGGVAGARAVAMPSDVLATLDPHRRTVAWAQRNLAKDEWPGGASTVIHGGGGGSYPLGLSAPYQPGTEAPPYHIYKDPYIFVNLHAEIFADYFAAPAASSLFDTWHSIMVSWSDGLGGDSRTGITVWDDGVIVGSSSTCPVQPNSLPLSEMVGFDNAAKADFEYWYEFNEFIPDGNELALKLWENPYYFFGRRGTRAWAYCGESMLMGVAS